MEQDIRWFECVDSTNNIASDRAEQDGDMTIYAAEFQTAGRGQKGNKWNSAKGENLTFSLLLKPDFLSPQNQFVVTYIATLGIMDYLKKRIPTRQEEIKIKWPNDIYVGKRKICGILIENSIKGESIGKSIVGIGLNVNQTDFPKELPNPTSMLLESKGERFDTHIELVELAKSILQIYQSAREIYSTSDSTNNTALSQRYLDNLYLLDKMSNYIELKEISANKPVETFLSHDKEHANQNGNIIKAKIVGISPQFCLILESEEGKRKEYAFKEIGYII